MWVPEPTIFENEKQAVFEELTPESYPTSQKEDILQGTPSRVNKK